MEPNKQAEHLEAAAAMLQAQAAVLRGERQDPTGMGFWRMACDRLEAATGCKVLSAEEWEALTEP